MILRPYQQQLVDEVRQAWQQYQDVIAVMATGAGKTVCISDIVANHDGPSRIIAHRQELVSQISLALARNNVKHSLIVPVNVVRAIVKLHMHEVGASFYRPNSQCAVAGVDTLVSLGGDPQAHKVTLWVTDEAHHCQLNPLNKWGKAVQLYPNAKGLGFTATPMRSDGNGLGRHNNGPFDVMVQGPSMRWLIDNGYLTDYKIYVPPNDVDLSNATISSTTGDYTKPSVKKALRKSHIVGDIVQHYLHIAPGKLGVTFCSDVEMSNTVAEAYRQAGIPALSLSAKTPDAERWDALRRFRNREILQLVNCALFDEGFDLPAIEVVSMARPTASYGLYVQTFGRGLRLMEGKQQAIIIDHVGNVLRHGLPDAHQDWTLDAKERRGRNTVDDAIPLRSCMECFGVYERIHAACPYCGHVYQPAGRGSPEQVDGSLIELDPTTLAQMRGEIERIDGSPTIPYGASPVVAASVKKRHTERQEAQATLRQIIAQWGGWWKHEGMTVDQTQRLFFFKFGIDVMTAQTLGKSDADKLRERICNDLSTMG